nr:M20 family metallopeptidase [Nocardioides thalensis]
MLDDLALLVAAESPSADHHAVAHSARVIADVGRRLLGSDPEILTIDGCAHLRWRRGRPGRGILVLGHHDTVFPVGTIERRPYSVEAGVVRGPGCLDMKAGLVMALHALALTDPDVGVTLLVTGDEEIGSPTSRALVEDEARASAACLVLEAAADDGSLKIARKGVSMYEIAVTGRAAHAGLDPERGVNATTEIAHQVGVVAGLADPGEGTTVTPTVLRSGTSANTVPDQASLRVDVRCRTRKEQERVHQSINALRPQDREAELRVVGGPNRPPLEDAASACLFRLAEAEATALGLSVSGAAVGGGSDGNLAAGVGTPTLDGLGAVGAGPHTTDEYVVVDELAPRTALLAALLHAIPVQAGG